ncbi:MAG: hypothetical protein AAF984_08000 [Verrucomicrobiota bacterium]
MNRRSFLLKTSMYSASLFCGCVNLADTTSRILTIDKAHSLIKEKHNPRVTIGNIMGKVLDIPLYLILAATAPIDLIRSFAKTISSTGGLTFKNASYNYIDYRYEEADKSTKNLTLDITKDVIEDKGKSAIMSAIIERDLSVGNELLKNKSIKRSLFREQLALLRMQLELLLAEQQRTKGESAIYLPTGEMIKRSNYPETEKLQNEISELRLELDGLYEKYGFKTIEDSSFIMRNKKKSGYA